MQKKNSKKKKKQLRRTLFLVLLGVVTTFLTGCTKAEDTPNNPIPIPIPTPATVENLLVVDKVIDSKIETVGENEIVVSDATTKIKEGNFIVSDITNKAPNGYLRKIVGVETKGGKQVLRTEDASLNDIIINGRVEFSKKFSANDILQEGNSTKSSIRITRSPHDNEGFYFKADKEVVIYDIDGNRSTKNDQLKAKGELDFTFAIDKLLIDYEKGNLNECALVTKFESNSKLRVSAGIEFKKKNQANLKKEFPFLDIPLQPFTIIIASVPVPIAKQRLVAYITSEGKISAKIEIGADTKSTMKLGFEYKKNNGGMKEIAHNDSKFIPIAPYFKGEASLKAGLAFGYEMHPYGMTNSKAGIKVIGYAEGTATRNSADVGTIDVRAGADLELYAYLSVLSRSLLGWNREIPLVTFPIWNGEWNPNRDLFIQTKTPIYGNNKEYITAGGIITKTPFKLAILERGVVWGTYNNPLADMDSGIVGHQTGKEKSTTENNDYTVKITNFPKNKKIYLRAYYKTAVGYMYGETKTIEDVKNVSEVGGNVPDIPGIEL